RGYAPRPGSHDHAWPEITELHPTMLLRLFKAAGGGVSSVARPEGRKQYVAASASHTLLALCRVRWLHCGHRFGKGSIVHPRPEPVRAKKLFAILTAGSRQRVRARSIHFTGELAGVNACNSRLSPVWSSRSPRGPPVAPWMERSNRISTPPFRPKEPSFEPFSKRVAKRSRMAGCATARPAASAT